MSKSLLYVIYMIAVGLILILSWKWGMMWSDLDEVFVIYCAVNWFLVFLAHQGAIGPGLAGTRLEAGSDCFDIHLFEYNNAQEWTLLYSPDHPDNGDVFFLYSVCSCGQVQLRLIVGYPLLVQPGSARPDFRLHEIGEGITRTPSLNVLRCDTIING